MEIEFNKGNQVQRTRFPFTENEFIELVFHELSSHGFALERSWSDVFISLSDRAESVRLLANEFIELVFIELSSHGFAWSSSAEDRWLRLQIVQFLMVKNKFKELVFYTWKMSSLNSFSMYGKRARSADAANDLLY